MKCKSERSLEIEFQKIDYEAFINIE